MANEQGFPDRTDSIGNVADQYPIKFSELRDVFSTTNSGSVSVRDYYRANTALNFDSNVPTVHVGPHNEMVPNNPNPLQTPTSSISLSDFEGSFNGVDVTKVYVHVIRGNFYDSIYLAVNVTGNKSHVYCSGFDSVGDNGWIFNYGGNTYAISNSDRDFFKGKQEEAHVNPLPVQTYGTITASTGPSTSETFTLIRCNNTNLSVLPSGVNSATITLNGWPLPWNTPSGFSRPRVAFVDYPF